MQAHADALALTVERAGEPRWRQAVARSVHGRRDAIEFDGCEVGRDAYPAYQREVGVGSVAVASIWLACYVIVAIHSLAFGN
jgi:hypothetical protein